MYLSPSFIVLLACGHLATAAAIGDDILSDFIAKRDKCSAPQIGDDDDCYSYCNPVTTQIDGPPIQASDEISCDTSSCSGAHANSVTITEGFSVSVGFSTKSAETPITASASFMFSQAISSTNTYTFTLMKGDSGHIEFTPRLNKVCGTLKKSS